MKFVTEDNINKFPCTLLDKNICEGLREYKNITRDISKMENTVCFIDLPADNDRVIENYRKARRRITEGSNTFLIPISCSEYIFIKTFIGYKTRESEAVLLFDDYRDIRRSTSGQLLSTVNYENFCKSVIATNNNCYRNGTFANVSCLCGNIIDGCIDMNLRTKQYLYAIGFPIPILKDVRPNINLILDIAFDLYYRMAEKFLKNGVISKIIEL